MNDVKVFNVREDFLSKMEAVSKKKKTDAWTDEMVSQLIAEWQQNECLYNSDHAEYHNARMQNISLELILQAPFSSLSSNHGLTQKRSCCFFFLL